MKKYHTQHGEVVRLGAVIGQGGEGTVYQVVKNDSLVVKIYKDISKQPTETPQVYAMRSRTVRKRQEQKILAMVANPPYDAMRSHGHVSIAWPTAAIYEGKQFVGFCMPKVKGFTVYEVLQPQTRSTKHPQWNHRTLYRLAHNMAKAVDALHRKGYVIGDVNFHNMLCQDNALVTLIDCDSMQVRDAQGQLYRCPVGMPEYTPRELQGADWTVVNRTVDHDCFGFAVILFQLLMQGFHPFAGRCLDPRKEIEQVHVYCITHGIFPYGDTTAFVPPNVAPAFALLPGIIQNNFRMAFTQPSPRPSAASWAEIIHEVEKRLKVCAHNPLHYYPSDGGCVVCAVEQNAARIKEKLRVTAAPPPLGSPPPRVTPPPPSPPQSSVSAQSTAVPATATWHQQPWWGKLGLIVMVLGTQVLWPGMRWVAVHTWQLLVFLWYATGKVCRQLLWPALKYLGLVIGLLFRLLGRAMWWFVWAPGARYRVVTVVVLIAIGGVYVMPKGYMLWSRIYPQCTATAMIQRQWPMLPPAVLAQMDANVAPAPIQIDGLFVANTTEIQRYQTQFAQCVGDEGVLTPTIDMTQVAIAHEYVLVAHRRVQYPDMQWRFARTIMIDIAQSYQTRAPHSGFVHLRLATLASGATPDTAYDWLIPTDGHWAATGRMATHNRTIFADGYVEGPFSDMQIVDYPTPSQLAVQLARNDIVMILPADAPMMAQYLAVAPFPADYRVLLIPTEQIYAVPR
jgi:DNA-binding helix-hairpin-helix protein with protein kinase domain